MKPALCLLLFILLASRSLADQSLGVTTIDVGAEDVDRPLQLSIWYAGTGGTEEIIGGNAVFSGEPAMRDASIVEQKFPLVLMSHGGLRSAADSGAWLSAALARSGYIVVEVNGQRPNSAAEAVNEIWHRPNDLSRALDTVLDDPYWSQFIDIKGISVVGFALGATAALMLSGGELDAKSFARSCDSPDGSPDCGWYGAQNVSLKSVNIEELKVPRKDPRIGSIVAIAPEYTGAFSEGMSVNHTPTLLVLLGGENDLSDGLSAKAAVKLVPNATESDGFQICTPAGSEILAEDGGDPSLCGSSAEERENMHRSISNSILSFLAEAISK